MINYINNYALAIFHLGLETNKLKIYQTQIELVIKVLNQNPHYLNLLNSFQLAKNTKIKLIKQSFANLELMLLQAILLLVIHNKIFWLKKILFRLIILIRKHQKTKLGVIYSTIALTPNQFTKISHKVSKLLGTKVIFSNKIDLSLIAGIKIVIGNHIIENSVFGQLNQLKQDLLKIVL